VPGRNQIMMTLPVVSAAEDSARNPRRWGASGRANFQDSYTKAGIRELGSLAHAALKSTFPTPTAALGRKPGRVSPLTGSKPKMRLNIHASQGTVGAAGGSRTGMAMKLGLVDILERRIVSARCIQAL
jgi:hypothetical protein